MSRAGIFRSETDFANEAIRDELRVAETIYIRDVSRRKAELLIDRYLTSHPGRHFASEIAEALGELRTTLDVIHHMIDSGAVRKSPNEVP